MSRAYIISVELSDPIASGKLRHSMGPIIAVVIGVLVLIVGFVIYQVALQILDEGDYFFYAVGFFLLLFLVAGMALYFLLPRPAGPAKLSSIAPGVVLNRVTELANGAYSEPLPAPSQSISYSTQD